MASTKRFVIKTTCPKTSLQVLIGFKQEIGSDYENTPEPEKIMGCVEYKLNHEGSCGVAPFNRTGCIYEKWTQL